MRKRIGIITAILIVACVGVAGWQLLRPPEPEPVYQGRPLSYWLTEWNGNSTAGATGRAEAKQAIKMIGTNALPTLLSMLRTRDHPLRDKFFGIVGGQRFVKIKSPRPSSEQQLIALNGLRVLETAASNALPQLMEIYERHPNALSQQIVPVVISGLGPSAKAAIPMLVRATANTNENVRNNSVYALGKIHDETELVVPALIKCLRDTSPDVQANAAIALEAFGAGAQPAVPALIALVKADQVNPAGAAGGQGHYFTSVGVESASRHHSLMAGPTNVDVITPVISALKAIDPEAVTKAGIK